MRRFTDLVRRHRLLTAVVCVVVLVAVAVFIRPWEDEQGPSEGAADAMADMKEAWPTASYDADPDDTFTDDAVEKVCPDLALCHLLWAEKGELDDFDDVARPAKNAYIARFDSADAMLPVFRLFKVEYRTDDDTSEEPELSVWPKTTGDDRDKGRGWRMNPDANALPVNVIAEDEDPGWLFPEGAEDVRMLRYSTKEKGVVTAPAPEPDGDSADGDYARVRLAVEDLDGIGHDEFPGPIVRYQHGGEDRYLSAHGSDACVAGAGWPCTLDVPTEEVLVSFESLTELHEADWANSETRVRFSDASVGKSRALGEGRGPARLAKVDWHANGDKPSDAPTTNYLLYFEDGSPALLSQYQKQSDEVRISDDSDGVSAFALFRDPDAEARMIPVAIHTKGAPPLLSPGLDVEQRGSGYTVYEPIDLRDGKDSDGRTKEKDPPSFAVTHRDAKKNPVRIEKVDGNGVTP